jgi:hypothetical protein
MTPRQLEILQHALGVDQFGRGTMYRSHFVTDPAGPDGIICEQLVARGWMDNHGKHSLAGGSHLYTVNHYGRAAVKMFSPAPPKLTRSQQRYARYRQCADCFESFWHFLKYESRKLQP